jgi:hypothetical protein
MLTDTPDPTGPDRPDGEARFRADLVAYLDSLSAHELGELLGELSSVRPGEPLRLGVLMIALHERLPDAYKLLPPAGQPEPVMGHTQLRQHFRNIASSAAPNRRRDYSGTSRAARCG